MSARSRWLPFVLLATATSCGSAKSASVESTDAGAGDGSSGEASRDAAQADAPAIYDAQGTEAGEDSASALVLNICKDSDFALKSNDYRGMTAIIYTGDEYAGEFSPYCMLINVGQSVMFQVETSSGAPKTFVNYPLQPFNGDADNPITATNDAETSVSFVFGAAGDFGFEDPKFASMTSLATGGIRVVP